MFGKIVLSQPLNYECEHIPDGIAPNIGYISQAFEVHDLGFQKSNLRPWL